MLLENKFKTLSDANIIMGGDFNCILNQDLDRNHPPSQPGGVSQYRDSIKALLEDKSLCDIWRLRHPEVRAYSFRRGSHDSRLDYIFISDHLSETVVQADITRDPHSDHSLLTVEFGQQKSTRGLDVSMAP